MLFSFFFISSSNENNWYLGDNKSAGNMIAEITTGGE